MEFDKTLPIKIIVLGTGGTGGWVASHVCQLCSTIDRKIDIYLCDGDIVEEKNLNRQNFIKQDISKNKAKVLAERYSAAYGVPCKYFPSYIESAKQLEELCKGDCYQQQPILIGAVDNNRTRELCDMVFRNSDNLIYIDSGNAEFTGQVVCGIREKKQTVYPPVSSLYPDLIEPDDVFPSELSCADRSLSSPQTVAANLMAATTIILYLYNILVRGELRTESVEFSASTISMRPRLEQRRDDNHG